jgi:hypothetical protein
MTAQKARSGTKTAGQGPPFVFRSMDCRVKPGNDGLN